MENQPQSVTLGAGCLVRMLWTVGGNATLVILGLYIFEKHAHALSRFDYIYLSTVLLIVISRFIDIRCLHGETVGGQPASMAHLRRFVVLIVPLSIIFLILVHVLGTVLR